MQGSAVCAEGRQVAARQSGGGGLFFGCGKKQRLFRLKVGGLALGRFGREQGEGKYGGSALFGAPQFRRVKQKCLRL